MEDESGTEVDEAVLADLSKVEGICFVIKDCHENGILKEFWFYFVLSVRSHFIVGQPEMSVYHQCLIWIIAQFS